MKKTIIAAGALGALAAGSAFAATAPGVALTVYNDNLGLVKDTRVLDLKKGIQEIRFDDVASQIDATSVHFRALEHPDGVNLFEQNYQYDLADADRLFSRYLGQSVSILPKADAAVSGKLLSFDPQSLVIQTERGVMIFNRTEVRAVNLNDLPGGVVVKPTLVWRLAANADGKEGVEVSYLTGGINWHAEYVAVVNAEDTNLDLTGWVSIDNQSGATYENAKLKLVAGSVHRAQPEGVPVPMMMKTLGRAMQADSAPEFQEESFFEYHLYTLDQPATVRDRETKQLSLFPSAGTAVVKKMTYDGERRPKDVVVSVEFTNAKAAGLGMPLPKGLVRVYKKAKDGAQEFVGEDRIDHTATDEKVRLTLGNAFDVVGERTQTDYQRIDDRTFQRTIKVELRNHKKETAAVSVVEHLSGDWTVTARSTEFKKTDSHSIEFPVTIPAGGSVTVTYTARMRY